MMLIVLNFIFLLYFRIFNSILYLKNKWKTCFKKGGRPLKGGDTMTITLKNGEKRYAINDVDLVNFIIDMANKKEIYLLIHIRNSKSKIQTIYFCEIFN